MFNYDRIDVSEGIYVKTSVKCVFVTITIF